MTSGDGVGWGIQAGLYFLPYMPWTERVSLPPTPQIHMLNPNTQCDCVRRQGLWEMIKS